MLSDPHIHHRPQTTAENTGNRRQNQPKIDATSNFAPWEDEDAMDYTSSHTLTLLGFKTAAGRPLTALTKASSFPNPPPEHNEGNSQNATAKEKKEFKKQVTIADRKDQRPSSFRPLMSNRIPTENEISPPASPKYAKASSNHPSHRDEAQNKPVVKIREPHRRNQWAAGYYSKERHTSEQTAGIARARSQEIDPSINPVSFGMQINRILDKTKSFNGKDGTIAEGNIKILDPQGGLEVMEQINSTNGSFMLVQDDPEPRSRKIKTSSISCRTSPKGVNGEFNILKGMKIHLQSPMPGDSKILTIENEASDGMKSPVEDGKEDQKKRSRLGKDAIPLKLATAAVHSKTWKLNPKGSSNKPKNLSSVMQIKQIGREGEEKDESTLESEIQFSSYTSQTLRPGTAKQNSAVKWFGRSSRVEEDGSGNVNVPSMLDCYKKNKKKYFYRVSNQDIQRQSANNNTEDLFKISQIPLLGNLKKMLDNKVKPGTSMNGRREKTRKVGFSLSPPPERALQQASISNLKIGESVISDKDMSQNNLKGKLEASLRQKMISFSGVITKKSDIFEERPTKGSEIFRVINERASIAQFTGYSPKKPKRPTTGMQLFRSWK